MTGSHTRPPDACDAEAVGHLRNNDDYDDEEDVFGHLVAYVFGRPPDEDKPLASAPASAGSAHALPRPTSSRPAPVEEPTPSPRQPAEVEPEDMFGHGAEDSLAPNVADRKDTQHFEIYSDQDDFQDNGNVDDEEENNLNVFGQAPDEDSVPPYGARPARLEADQAKFASRTGQGADAKICGRDAAEK